MISSSEIPKFSEICLYISESGSPNCRIILTADLIFCLRSFSFPSASPFSCPFAQEQGHAINDGTAQQVRSFIRQWHAFEARTRQQRRPRIQQPHSCPCMSWTIVSRDFDSTIRLSEHLALHSTPLHNDGSWQLVKSRRPAQTIPITNRLAFFIILFDLRNAIATGALQGNATGEMAS